jgi:hypothetical protein
MKNIDSYEDCSSSSYNYIIRNISRVNEKFGTPQILKEIFKDLLELVNKMISNKKTDDFIELKGEYTTVDNKYLKFDKTIKITIQDKKRLDIYSRSTSDSIYLELNFQSHDDRELKRVLFHELLHIYEIFFRMENNKKSLQWSLNSILNDIRDKYEGDNFLSILIYYIYLSYDHEINARVCETYMILMDLMSTNKSEILEELKNTNAWKYKNMLSNFEIKNVNYNNLFVFLKDFNSKVNEKQKINNRIFQIPNNIKDSKSILKEWKILFKKKSKYFESKLIKVVDDVVFDVNMINNTKIDEFNNFEIIYPIELIRESKIRKVLRENH